MRPKITDEFIHLFVIGAAVLGLCFVLIALNNCGGEDVFIDPPNIIVIQSQTKCPEPLPCPVCPEEDGCPAATECPADVCTPVQTTECTCDQDRTVIRGDGKVNIIKVGCVCDEKERCL